MTPARKTYTADKAHKSALSDGSVGDVGKRAKEAIFRVDNRPWSNRQNRANIKALALFSDKISVDSGSAFELLTIADMARLLKISATGVRRLQQTRQLPFFKVGGSVRFAKSDIMAYLEKRRVESIE
jgi:excisionase family DNA binding protein